jgi:hypothetical protein
VPLHNFSTLYNSVQANTSNKIIDLDDSRGRDVYLPDTPLIPKGGGGLDCVNGSRRIMNGIALKYDLHDAYIPG